MIGEQDVCHVVAAFQLSQLMHPLQVHRPLDVQEAGPPPAAPTDQTAGQALAHLGAGESQVRDAITALQAESGPEHPA